MGRVVPLACRARTPAAAPASPRRLASPRRRGRRHRSQGSRSASARLPCADNARATNVDALSGIGERLWTEGLAWPARAERRPARGPCALPPFSRIRVCCRRGRSESRRSSPSRRHRRRACAREESCTMGPHWGHTNDRNGPKRSTRSMSPNGAFCSIFPSDPKLAESCRDDLKSAAPKRGVRVRLPPPALTACSAGCSCGGMFSVRATNHASGATSGPHADVTRASGRPEPARLADPR